MSISFLFSHLCIAAGPENDYTVKKGVVLLTKPFLILSLLYLAASIAEIYVVDQEKRKPELFIKPVLMLILIAACLTQGIGIAPLFLLLALFCCFLGDTFLLFEKWFLPGLLAFLAGHICYIILFCSQIHHVQLSGVLLLAGLYLILFGLVYRRLRQGLKMRTDQISVTCYMVLILSMSLLAGLRAFSLAYQPAALLVWAGTICFILSDTALAFQRFSGFSHKRLPAFIMTTYLLAQYMILYGILF